MALALTSSKVFCLFPGELYEFCLAIAGVRRCRWVSKSKARVRCGGRVQGKRDAIAVASAATELGSAEEFSRAAAVRCDSGDSHIRERPQLFPSSAIVRQLECTPHALAARRS